MASKQQQRTDLTPIPMLLHESLYVGVLPHSVVDNSEFTPSRLTDLVTLRILASRGALPSPDFKQRGFV